MIKICRYPEQTPVELAAGAIGKNKAMNSCMACGHQWSPAKVAKAAQTQANKEALGSTADWAIALVIFGALMKRTFRSSGLQIPKTAYNVRADR